MMHGLNTYDYGARQMDPVICQWTTVDPLAEEHYNVSPYACFVDNLVNGVRQGASTELCQCAFL